MADDRDMNAGARNPPARKRSAASRTGASGKNDQVTFPSAAPLLGDAMVTVLRNQLDHEFGSASSFDTRLLAVAGFDITALAWALGHTRELGPLWWLAVGVLALSLVCFLIGIAPTSFEFGPKFPPGKARAALVAPAIDVYEALIVNYEAAKIHNRSIVNRKALMFRLSTGVLVVPTLMLGLYWVAWLYRVI